MTTLTRRAPALLLALLIALAGSLLWSSPAQAATATQTVKYSYTGVLGLTALATVSPARTTITVGQTVAFTDSDTATLVVTEVGASKPLVTVAAGKTSAPIRFDSAGTITYAATSDHGTLLGTLQAAGTIVVSAPVAASTPAPPQSSAPGSSAPTSHPTAAPTTKSGAAGSGGSTGGSGESGQSTNSGTGAAAGGGNAPVTPATTPPSIFGGFAPGDFGTLAPAAGDGGDVLPPVIAPYATVTGPDGVPSTLYTTYTPTPSPVAAIGSGSGGGGDGRAIGLTGTVTAVLLVGLLAAFGRLLLAHPAAATRRH